ncbi:MAG: BON domain-containing protein [Gemmataceae bacterium]
MRRTVPLLLCLLAGGCSTNDGDVLSQVFHRTGKKIETTLGNAPGEMAARFRVPVVPMGPAERVQKRVEWDRFLEGVAVEIDSPAEGVVRLRGEVKDTAAKGRIAELAKATVGVTEVRDELRLPQEK